MRMNYPAPARVRMVDFPKLTGGLNLRELSYRLPADQSPFMKNLWWQNGVLQSRDGQIWLTDDTARGAGYTCCPELFWDCAFFHIGEKLWFGNPETEPFTLQELCAGVPGNRGTFFRYLDWLFYKNQGGFFRIEYRPGESPKFRAAPMTELAYTPVVAINAHPKSGSGDTYQPENRLSPRKTIRYNAVSGEREYQLPAAAIGGVDEVKVDGAKKQEGTDYQVDKAMGKVTFTTAPPVTDPPTNNTVEITYRKDNPDAMKSVMDCTYAAVSGGDRSICILLAGSTAQPNAVFWNANDNLSMNPGYFPITTYNLAGDTQDPVTGFGRQYGDTLVLKAHSVGRLAFSVDRVDDRNIPLFTYTNINNKVGCDLPWTIQLIENNLIFCNTYQGVHVVRSSSAAYENNIECISLNVNGDRSAQGELKGLLADVRAGNGVVTSFDDDNRYWLCANGHAYLWDYLVSHMGAPCWHYQTEIRAVSFFRDRNHRSCHLDAQGRVTRLERCFHDYGAGIDKAYQFPVTYFNSYQRLKDVTAVTFSTRSDTETHIKIRYDTDYESRHDRTEGATWQWSWAKLDLREQVVGYYNPENPRYATVIKRRPGCRHVRHFTMTLSNDQPNEDLAIVSAQFYFKLQGEER